MDNPGSIFDNLLFVVLGGVLLALFASIAGGAVIAALAVLLTRFFRRNLPTDEEMTQLKAEYGASGGSKRRRLTINPTAEPFVISIVGFVLFFFLSTAALAAIPPPIKGEEVVQTPAAAEGAGLPKSGDLVKITDGLPAGDAENGAKLFVSSGCVGCHSQIKDQRLVGPSFHNLWDRAATRVPGLSSKEYLYQSIVDPNAFVVPTFQPNLMQQNYAALLSPQQMADILAWIEERHSNEP